MSIQFNACRYVAVLAVLAVIAALVPLPSRAGVIGGFTANGFTFINFDPSTGALAGSNANGISNKGHVVGTGANANGTFANFTGTPALTTALNLGAQAMAFGINSAGYVVGTDNGAAFFLTPKGVEEPLLVPMGATSAFGISDRGYIVGQFTHANGATPGFFLRSRTNKTFVTIDAPSGPNIVNAQAINNFGLIVGFYVGTDGQDHGLMANLAQAHKGVLTGIAIPDPAIPNVAGEPGAAFVFSQLLGVNDAGIAVGYYGDSTTSQHGFIYNTNTGTYTFLDDPAEAFSNGVEVTQITGIADSGELTGFYTDANAVAHSFTACPPYAFCPNYPNDLP